MKKNYTVLIIDDDVDLVDTIESIIKFSEPEIIVNKAHTGKDGLKIVYNNSPDLLVLDVKLPDIKGDSICKKLKNDPAVNNIPILIITGMDNETELKSSFLELGAEAFIKKPFDKSELMAQIKSLLRLKIAEDKLRDQRDNLLNEVADKDGTIDIYRERWHLILENIFEGIWDWEIANNQITYSPKYLTQLGYNKPESLLNKDYSSFENIIHPDDLLKFQEEIKSYLHHGCPEFKIEIRLRHQDGTYHWFQQRGYGIWDKESGEPLRMIGIMSDISAQRNKICSLENIALYDFLTRLPNRVLFYDLVNKSIATSKRSGTVVGFLFIDLDNFKDINDKYGHYTGDRTLKNIAADFEKILRPVDIVARFGGDEFVVVIPNLPDEDHLNKVIDRIRQEVEGAVVKDDYVVKMSIGHSFYPQDGDNIDTLLNVADNRMYQEKMQKKGEA